VADIPYRCDDLEDRPWPVGCRDFTPSAPEEMTEEEYEEFLSECRASLSDPDLFRALGCKREAHLMLPGGREQYRGLSRPESEQRDAYFERLQQSPPVTPVSRRTQSDKERRYIRTEIEESFLKCLEENRNKRYAVGLSATKITPGTTPEARRLDQELLETVRCHAIPRRFVAFRETFKRYGLQFAPDQMNPVPFQVRVLALSWGLAPYAVLNTNEDAFFGRDAVRGRQLTGLVLASGDINRSILTKLTDILINSAAYKKIPVGDRTGQQQATLFAVTVLFKLLVRLNEMMPNNPVIGLVYGSGEMQTVIRLPRKTTKGEAGRKLTVPVLQHLISPQSTVVRVRPDIQKLRYITPEALMNWLLGATVKRQRKKGRRLKQMKARQNPAKPSFIDFTQYADLQPGESRQIPQNPHYCVYRTADRTKLSFPLAQQLKVTTCARAASWQALARSYGDTGAPPPTTTSMKENPMPRKKRTRRSRSTQAKLHRVSARQHFSRASAPASFDPLAELIKEFTPQSAPRVQAKPVFSRQKSPITRATDPYSTSVRAFGARPAVPVNRRNPGRKKARSNPDAAAAMKLHHETGMSLKKAWKCVKRGESPYDFGSQYEYRRGPYTAADASPPVNRRNPVGKHKYNEMLVHYYVPKMNKEGAYLTDEEDMMEVSLGGIGQLDEMNHRRRAIAAAHISNAWDVPYGIALESIIEIDYGAKLAKKLQRNPSLRSRRRKKARSNPDAAAAMELHHNTGISLKQAWKRVKRGDY